MAIHPPLPKPPRFDMHVHVRLESGAEQDYDGQFAHTFDAYDDALSRFPTVARIEVTVKGAPHAPH
jgi:hypothetical protein